jgi:hypothetical protein
VVAPTARVWAFDQQTTWLSIVNDLLVIDRLRRGLVGLERPYLRAETYQTAARPHHRVDLHRRRGHHDAVHETVHRTGLHVRPEPVGVYRSNNIDGSTPMEGDGIYTYTNDNIGDTSVTARGGTGDHPDEGIDVADQGSLIVRAQQMIAADMDVPTTIPVETPRTRCTGTSTGCLMDSAAGPSPTSCAPSGRCRCPPTRATCRCSGRCCPSDRAFGGWAVDNAEELINLIDQRIRAAASRDRHWGTIVQRDTTGPGAMVVFDGSTVAMPVKVAGGIFAREGDRCLLDRYGSDWIVSNSWAAVALGEATTNTLGPSIGSGTLTSSTFVDINEFTPMLFTKAYDQTFVRLGLTAGCFCNASGGTSVRWGVRVTPVDTSSPFAAVDMPIGSIYFNQTGVHMQGYWAARLVSLNDGGPPAGDYMLSLRWLRWGGSGNLQFDSGDYFMLEADEGVRTVQRFL